MFVFLVGARDGQMFVDPYLSKVMKYVLKMWLIIEVYWEQQDNSTNKGTCYQAWQSEFDPWDLHGERREVTLERCPLNSTLCGMSLLPPIIHTNKKTNVKILRKTTFWAVLTPCGPLDALWTGANYCQSLSVSLSQICALSFHWTFVSDCLHVSLSLLCISLM